MVTYNLSIYCVSGDCYGLISTDKSLLLKFLERYDHEGSSVSMVKAQGEAFESINDPEKVYEELRS